MAVPRRAGWVLAVAVLTSCATLQRSQDEGNARQVTDLVDSGQAEKLAAMSALPFLLDQEIVLLPADTAAFWKALAAAGFHLGAAGLLRALPAAPENFSESAPSMEVKTFFKKYVHEGARILELETGAGRKVLLIIGEEAFSRKIYGFKGPY
jgi:hypothetical protein